jgi:hypothetical protein
MLKEIKSQPSIIYDGPAPYGAPMGRREFYDNPTGKVTTFRVRIDSGGYDRGGNYWGFGDPLYCQCEVNDNGFTSECMNYRLFARAKSKAEALEKFDAVRKAKNIHLPCSLDQWIKDHKFMIDQAMIREYGIFLNFDPATRLNAKNRRAFVLKDFAFRNAAYRMNVREVVEYCEKN